MKKYELVVTGDNTKNTKNAIIQSKYKKHRIFVKNANVSKNCKNNIIFLDLLKLHKLLSLSAKFQGFGIFQSDKEEG